MRRLWQSGCIEEAGADIIFVEAPETESEMKKVNEVINKPTLANMVSGGKTPIFSSTRLADMGYSVAIHPALGFLAMGKALKTASLDWMRLVTSKVCH